MAPRRTASQTNATTAGNGPPAALVGQLETASEAFGRGDLDGAERIYRAVLAEEPENPDGLHGLGAIALRRDEPVDAVLLIERALRQGRVPGQFFTNYGVALQKLGRHEEALKAIRRGLSQDRSDPELHRNLGVLLHAQGKDAEAIRSLQMAARLDPEQSQIQKMLGELHVRHGRFEEALQHYRRHLEQDPDDPDVLTAAAFILGNQERHQEVVDLLMPAAEAGIETPEICNNIGSALVKLHRKEEAEAFILRAAELDPTQWQFLANIGGLMLINDRVDEAIETFERLRRENPTEPLITTDLALIYIRVGRIDDAIALLQEAVQEIPDSDAVWTAFGIALGAVNRYAEAEAAYRTAIELNPMHFHANDNLAITLKLQTKLDEANFFANKALHLPGYEAIKFANAFQIFHATCDYDGVRQVGDFFDIAETKVPPMSLPGVIFEMMVHADTSETMRRLVGIHRRWGEAVEGQVAANPLPPIAKRAKHERLRVGFLSSDLRDHAVGRHIMPLLQNYDRERFAFYAYTPWDLPDDPMQQEIASRMEAYRPLANRRMREIAQVIREDDIDILFELNGHTLGSRLEALAYRPAPVQIEWLGYPFTTGLREVDYFLLDERLAPRDPSFMIETPLVMPRTWTTFTDYPDAEITDTLPVEQNGYITFGTLNNPYKLTPRTIAAWSRVLRAVPDAKLVFVRPETASMVLCANIANEFGRHGINAGRLGFVDNRAQRIRHLECYNGFDLSMDTFPVTGGTTTCDALWMGVPVVTQAGDAYHQRISAGLLEAIGLGELVTTSEDEFVERSVGLAGDIESLKFLRQNLRPVLRDSVLCDIEGYTKDFQDTLTRVAKDHGLA